MAKNFYSLEDPFQASYILESLMENYSQFEELSIKQNPYCLKSDKKSLNKTRVYQKTKDDADL